MFAYLGVEYLLHIESQNGMIHIHLIIIMAPPYMYEQ